jgi:riboflavin synthase
MFTGIIQSVGMVRSAIPKSGDIEVQIEAQGFDFSATVVGDSIACSGCCLTVTALNGQSFCADVSRETLAVTTLGSWREGVEVNLESALRAGDALGGHYVSGHVDAVGTVSALNDDGRSLRVHFEIPKSLGRFVARKGSICVDGVSLTVNGVGDMDDVTQFDVNLIPHTRVLTTLRNYQVGTQVNVEIDMMARYLERISGQS